MRIKVKRFLGILFSLVLLLGLLPGMSLTAEVEGSLGLELPVMTALFGLMAVL